MGFLEEDIQSGVPSAHWMLSDIFIQKLQKAKVCPCSIHGSKKFKNIHVLFVFRQSRKRKRRKENSGNELGFQDSNFVELALRVLGLMCDGQNKTLQVNCKKKLSTIFTIVMKQVEISSLILA